MDLFLAVNGANELYQNSGDGTFSEIGSTAGIDDSGNALSCTWADYDAVSTCHLCVLSLLAFSRSHSLSAQDGDLDVYVTNTYTSDNLLYQNDGSCGFTDVASTAGVAVDVSSNGGVWGDYDADGDVDLFVVNAAWDANGGPNMLFQNQV